MNITEMTGREARAINPTTALMIEVVDHIVGLGWKWKVASQCPPHIQNPYSWGWWYNPNDERKPRPAGDAGNMHIKAWDTFKCYIVED
jgi:hypothetical protein